MTFTPDQMPILTLNSGQKIPQLGLGVYKVTQDIADSLVQHAIDVGYRRIDTAALYDNELEVGAAIRKSGLPRNELFVTTKIWNDRQGYASSLEAIDEALEKLNIEYIDMLLIHWPVPKQDKYVETWQAFEHALASGRIKGIGVSNFEPEHLTKLMAAATVTPALNQVELHPGLQQAEVRSFDAANGIATEAWSPLARGRFSDNPVLLALADKHGKTVTQVIVRWHIQIGNLVIPKTSHPDRLAENIDVFDFELDATDLAQVATLEANFRTGAHPNNL